MTRLLDLPPEVHLEINSWLPQASQVCLSYTCRYFRAVLDFPPQPSKSAIGEFNLERERKDPDRQRRTCSHCSRLRPFFHFSKRQASCRTNSSVRRCLDCLPGSGGAIGQSVVWILDTEMTQCPHCLQMVIYEVEEEKDGFLVIPSHVGADMCSRHRHRVRLADRFCTTGDVFCCHRCETCHQHCGVHHCFATLIWGQPTCTRSHDNNHVVWNFPEQPPSGPEIVVYRLRAMLDRVWPPPLRADLRSIRRRSQDCSIGELIDSMFTSDLERQFQRLLDDGSEPRDTGERKAEPSEERQAAGVTVPQ